MSNIIQDLINFMAEKGYEILNEHGSQTYTIVFGNDEGVEITIEVRT